MEIGEVFYARDRNEWRAWLEANAKTAPDIWLRCYHKASGKVTIPYDESVEEALCFGWIDGIKKNYDHESAVQRFTPRRRKSVLSEINRWRIFKLIRQGKMTEAGLEPVRQLLGREDDPLVIPEEILSRLQADPAVWQNFQAFPFVYQRIRIGYLADTLRTNREMALQRLDYLIKMTAQNKMFGTVVELPE